MELKTTSAPHVTGKDTAFKLELLTLIALLPACFAGIYFFGLRALLIILVSVIAAFVVEFAVQKIRKEKFEFPVGGVITGLLLALIIPSTVPLWIPVVGVIFGLLIGKHAFGKRNHVFNPALVARGFLVSSWPVIMTTYAIDAVTKATPLTIAKNQGISMLIQEFSSKALLYKDLFFGNVLGAIGETSAIALLIGGIFLIIMKVIDWKIPVFYIGSVGLLTLFFRQDILLHLFGGGLIIGAFFMATDFVTTPLTSKGRIIFAICCGLITFILRLYSGMAEGVMFSILIMNAFTPIIDRYTVPKVFGYKK